MSVDVARLRLSILGPPDLLVTALVAALGMYGVDVERLPLHETPSFSSEGPDVLIVDVDTHNPAPAVRDATAAGRTVLAIGSESNRERVVAAIAAGAVGWIPKTCSLRSLADTVREAGSGRLRMSEQRRAEWLAEHRSNHDSVRADVERLEQLSRREREVLCHLSDGLRAAEIAGVLVLSITTVRSHIRSILVKLGVNSQHAAADLHRDTSRRVGRILGAGPGR